MRSHFLVAVFLFARTVFADGGENAWASVQGLNAKPLKLKRDGNAGWRIVSDGFDELRKELGSR